MTPVPTLEKTEETENTKKAATTENKPKIDVPEERKTDLETTKSELPVDDLLTFNGKAPDFEKKFGALECGLTWEGRESVPLELPDLRFRYLCAST